MRRVSLGNRAAVTSLDVYDDSSTAASPEGIVRRFRVVFGDVSSRKHKRYQADGELHCQGKTATLLDDDGNVLTRGSFTGSQLESLRVGSTLVVGGKELLVDEALGSEACASPRQMVPPQLSSPLIKPLDIRVASSTRSSGGEPPIKKRPTFPQTPKEEPLEIKAFKRFTVPIPGYQSTISDPSAEFVLNSKEFEAGTEAKVAVAPRVAKLLRPHQRDGIQFIYDRLKVPDRGVILADEMGLGKTLQTIAVIWALVSQVSRTASPRRCLVVAPSSLLGNWMREFRKWIHAMRIPVILARSAKEILAYRATSVYQPFLLVSYETALRQVDLLAKIGFDILVCDEAHRLKNAMSKARIQLDSLGIRRRLLLTGTPMQNELDEFHSLLDFARPGFYGTALEFTHLCEDENPERMEEKRALNEKIIDCMLRRTAEVNHENLPPKHDYILFCVPSMIQSRVYEVLLNEMTADPLILIDYMRKLSNHPKLLLNSLEEAANEERTTKELAMRLLAAYPKEFLQRPASIEDSGKLAVLLDLITSFRLLEERAVIVSNYTKVLDMLQSVCMSIGAKVYRLDGSVPAAQRQLLVDGFNHCDAATNAVFLLSAKAGGVGLNLIGASRLVLFDSDWNPASDLQAMARIWRDGQRRPCHIYRLCTAGTIDEKILQRQIRKTGISSMLDPEAIANSADGTVKFCDEDLKDIFSFNYISGETDCETHRLMECRCGGDGITREEREDTQEEEGTEEYELPPPEEEEKENDAMPEKAEEIQEGPEVKEEEVEQEETAEEKSASMAELFNWRHYSPAQELQWKIFQSKTGLASVKLVEVAFAMQLDSNFKDE